MEFFKSVHTNEFLSPPSFERDVHHIEYRQDPLTGISCRLNLRRHGRAKQGLGEESETFLLGMDNCPFCGDNVERFTPKFAPDFCPDGRMRKGQSVLFPNLFPLAEQHVTSILTERHSVNIDGFTKLEMADSLFLAQEYLRRISKGDLSPRYPIYLWNHLPPSAASIIHPHTQVLVDGRGTPYQERLVAASEAYFSRIGRCYWEDLIKTERDIGERFIAESESLTSVASYAPQGNREVTIIFKRAMNLLDLLMQEVEEMAGCLVGLLRGYSKMGINSFNLSTFAAPAGKPLASYRLHAKLIARPVYQSYYRNDTGILERFHYDADVEVAPEVFAREMRSHFGMG